MKIVCPRAWSCNIINKRLRKDNHVTIEKTKDISHYGKMCKTQNGNQTFIHTFRFRQPKLQAFEWNHRATTNTWYPERMSFHIVGNSLETLCWKLMYQEFSIMKVLMVAMGTISLGVPMVKCKQIHRTTVYSNLIDYYVVMFIFVDSFIIFTLYYDRCCSYS